jgi:hypothetical protein
VAARRKPTELGSLLLRSAITTSPTGSSNQSPAVVFIVPPLVGDGSTPGCVCQVTPVVPSPSVKSLASRQAVRPSPSGSLCVRST